MANDDIDFDLVEKDFEILGETEKAIKLQELGNDPFWLPKSQIGKMTSGFDSFYTPKVGVTINSIEVAKWLVEEKGL